MYTLIIYCVLCLLSYSCGLILVRFLCLLFVTKDVKYFIYIYIYDILIAIYTYIEINYRSTKKAIVLSLRRCNTM